MAEDLTELVARIGIETVLVVLAKQVEEVVYIVVMNKRAVIVGTKELAEVESLLVVGIGIHQPAEVVSIDVDLWQTGIRVRVAHVQHVPFRFGFLLHDIVPREDLVLLIVVEEIERRAAEAKHLRVLLREFLDDAGSELRLCTLVSLVDNQHVPVGGVDLTVLVELSANLVTASQILHGSEIDILVALACQMLQRLEALAFGPGAVIIFFTVVENLVEVLKPSFIDNGAMGEDERTGIAFLFDDLQGRECLAETHLGVPEHLVAFLKLFDGPIDGVSLLGTEDDGCLLMAYLVGVEACLAVLDGLYGTFHSLEVTAVPFVGTLDLVECLLLDARASQYLVHLLVVERLDLSAGEEDSHLRVEQLIGDACRLRVFVDTLAGSTVEDITVRLRKVALILLKGCLAYLQAVLVPFIMDGEDVYES